MTFLKIINKKKWFLIGLLIIFVERLHDFFKLKGCKKKKVCGEKMFVEKTLYGEKKFIFLSFFGEIYFGEKSFWSLLSLLSLL